MKLTNFQLRSCLQWLSTQCHINNTENFVKRIKNIRVDLKKCLYLTYDVSSLFTCIPVNNAIEVVADLKRDLSRKNKTNLFADQVVKRLDLHFNNSYVVTRDQ